MTAGTILQDTKLPLSTWFLAAYLILSTKKGVSTLELARKAGVSDKTAWFLHHKILHVLGRNQAHDLFGVLEADETFLGGKGTPEGGRPRNQQTVLGVVERRPGKLGRLRLVRVPDRSGNTLRTSILPITRPGSTLRTDGWSGYTVVPGLDHAPTPDSQATAPGHQLPAIHLVFSNLRRVMKGVHTTWGPDRLQAYLDTYAYRFNHRNDLGAGVKQAISSLVHLPPYTRTGILAGGAN